MRKNIRILYPFNHIKKILPLILFSCVYYNTFYNAEVNYKKAERIIEQTPPKNSEDNKIPSQAKKLLGQAIENSNIVINSYPESKYVDDAYFIIGKASFLRKELFNAEKYLKKLIELYPDSKHHNEAQIWLIYTYVKMNDLDLAKAKLNNLKTSKNKDSQFLINNILAEVSIYDNKPFEAYNYYNKCIKITNDKSQKTSTYLKLLNISKEYNHLDSSVIYLDKLSEYSSGQIKKDIKLDWIKYSREAGKFDDLLVEIDVMLTESEYSSIYIKLELERSKIYLDQNDFESAKIFLSELADKYSRKNESAEALYHLGNIALMENFDLDLALEYFEKSKKDRKSSLYGKRSRDMINRINEYNNLNEELDYILSGAEKIEENESSETINSRMMPKPKAKKNATPDSLLFVISEKLLFDFKRLEDAKINYENLITSYLDSKFRPQALYVLSFYFSDEGWKDILQRDYPESQFNLDNKKIKFSQEDIDETRDGIWDICENSYNICAEQFLDLYNQKDDNSALYYYSFINDIYLNKIEESIDGYNKYIQIGLDLKYFNEATERLNEIENSIYSSIELTNQKMNYYYAIESFQLGNELDSILVKINKTIEGSFSEYKSSAQSIKSRINKLISLKKDIAKINNDSLSKDLKIDSLYFIVAKIYELDFMVEDSATIYFETIINNFSSSNFRYQSLTALNNIDNIWKKYLIEEYPDSIYMSDSSYKQINIISEVYKESFINDEMDRLELLDSFSSLFLNENDTIVIIDTANVKLDTLNKVFEINE